MHRQSMHTATQAAATLDGRVLLAISADDKREPRFQIEEQEARSQQLFGVDVEGLHPGAAAVIDASTLGYPVRSLDQLPAGDYYVQAVLNVYETFTRADGHAVKLPPDQGEGQQWNRKPGNLYSKPLKMHIDPASGRIVTLWMPPERRSGANGLALGSALIGIACMYPVFEFLIDRVGWPLAFVCAGIVRCWTGLLSPLNGTPVVTLILASVVKSPRTV